MIYGDRDQVVYAEATVAFTKGLVQNARAVIYEGIGQAPFIETPVRFNSDLMEFVRPLHLRETRNSQSVASFLPRWQHLPI